MDDDLLVGRYQRVRHLGSGGMGDVWLADDLELGRPVAVKRLRFGGPAGLEGELVERMLREARVVARLKHPAIVTLHDLVRVEGRPYLIMEYVEGESLADRIARVGMLPWREVAPAVADIAGALAAAHRAGVLHRDVKPANVLLDLDGRAHLADFGIARGADDAVITQQGELVGTVAYMPPEIAKNQEATPASDVWSLGATFFAAVEGAAPFADSASGAPAIIARLIRDEPPPPRRAGMCADLLSRMLASEPAQRPYAVAVATEVAELLAVPAPPPAPETREASLPQVVTAVEPVPVSPPPRSRRRRWPMALAALILVAAAVVAGVLLIGDDGGSDDDPGPEATGFPSQEVGADPDRPELAADGTVYVSARGDDVVMRVRPSGDARMFEVGDAPGMVAVSSDGAFVYVPCADGSVWVVDSRARAARPLVELDGVPGPLRLSEDDATLYVPVDDGTIAVIDVPEGEVRATLDVGPEPELVHLSPDGGTGYSPDRGEGAVTVIDTASASVETTIEVPGANGVQFTPDGSRALVTARGGQVHEVDVADHEVVRVIELGSDTRGRIRIDPTGTTAWVPDTEGTSIWVVDIAAGEVVGTVDLDGTPGNTVVFDSSGAHAYVPDHGSGDVAVVDTATYEVTHAEVGPSPVQLAVSDDDTLLYAVGHRDGDADRGTITAVPLPRS